MACWRLPLKRGQKTFLGLLERDAMIHFEINSIQVNQFAFEP